jgi:hypothetical protein
MRPIVPAVLLVAAAGLQEFAFEPYQSNLSAGATLSNAAADFDGDGDPDLFLGFNGEPNRLFRNDKGTLTDVAADVGVADARATRAAAWADVDADGDPDLLLGFAPGSGSILRFYRNDAAKFHDQTKEVGLIVESGAVRQLSFVDVDGDDDLDLFVAFRDRSNALYRNDRGAFTDVAASLGLADARKTVGAVWFDEDEDGDLDLYLANQDGDANGLFRNDRGRFTDVAAAAGLRWAGRTPEDAGRGTVRPCAADVNGDGRIDVVAANYGTNGLFLNRGGGTFEDASAAWGIATDGRHDTCAIGDFDNDGRVDVYINGTVTGGVSYRDFLLRNAGTRFDDVTPSSLLAVHASHGALWLDVDSDGDEDLALAGSRPEPLPLVWRNALPASPTRRWLTVRVVDGRGRATRAGAEVRVYAAGTRKLIATRLVDTGSGYNAQSDVPIHVGVGAEARVDVEAISPRRGRRAVNRSAGVETGRSQPLLVKIQ